MPAGEPFNLMSPNYTDLFAARREMKNSPGVNRYLSGDDGGQATARHLVDVAMPHYRP
jgi:hypothetical protein